MSEEQDVVVDLLCVFSNEAKAKDDLQIGRFGVKRDRDEHLDVDLWKGQGWEDKTAESYVSTLSNMEQSQNRVFDLRVPGVKLFCASTNRFKPRTKPGELINGAIVSRSNKKPPLTSGCFA